MKKTLLTILACLAVAAARADLIWYEPFNYPNGSIISNSVDWVRHSGTANPSDAIVFDHRLEVSASSPSTLPRTDDVNRKFPGQYTTNGPMVVYSSFSVTCTNLPPASGTYFAHFLVNNTTFHGRVFAQAGTIPGTWRLGIAGAAGSPSQVYPVDLATNVDYQVVMQWDPVTLWSATLWVNPTSVSDVSVTSIDTISSQPAASAGFAFRQGGSFGSAFFAITNLAVATSFDEAATNVWAPGSTPPSIVYQPDGFTNFVGVSNALSSVANGQGLAGYTYQWYKDGGAVSNPNGNSGVLPFSSLNLSDSGSYTVVVSDPSTSLSVTSAVASIQVTNPPVPPTFTLQPTNATKYYGQSATFHVAAIGPTPISFQWYYNGAPATGPNVTGADTDTLVVSDVEAANGTAGTYRCDATNPFGTTTGSNAVLTALSPVVTNIGYLHTLVDPVFYLPTNTTTLYQVTGIVTTYTNITTAANSEFFVQDDTGGIAVFFGGSTTARPQAGDSVTVVGPLGQFNGLLELNLNVADSANKVVINSSGNPLPPGVVLPFSFTNSAAYGGVSNALRLYECRVVTYTNVYFVDADGSATFGSGVNYTITNQNGETAVFRVDSRVTEIIGQTIPPFAWTVTGPMSYFLGATDTNRSAGYELLPTRLADIVTVPPEAVSLSETVTGTNTVLSWTAQPYSYSYSVFAATNVTGPYLPLATGLIFTNAAGSYIDTNAGGTSKFYRVASP